MNFRNIIDHNKCWPVLNEAEYRDGAEPIFAAYERPAEFVASHVLEVVKNKRDQVVEQIGLANVINLFAGRKALPAFLAFCLTRTGKVSALGPIPASITMLSVGEFGGIEPYKGSIEKINNALHECVQK